MTSVNLNDFVTVILTKAGADRLNSIHEKYKSDLRFSEGEEYTTQLHGLINDFGDMIRMGSNILPFKSNNIYIDN